MKLCSVAKPILVAAFLLTAAPAGAQSKEQKAGARAAAEAGGDAFDAGKYAEAADLYDRAERLMHAPPHLLYGARAHAKLGHLVEARELYLALTREQLPASAPRAFKDARQMGEKELDELEPRVPSLSVVVQPGAGATDVRVIRNGEPVPGELLGVPAPINPGEYSYQAFAEGMESAATTVKIKEGSRETVLLTLRAIPGYKKSPKPAAAGAVGVTTTTGGGSLSDPPPSDSGGGGGRPLLIGSLVSFGVGAVGIGIGTVFMIQSSGTRDDSNTLYTSCNTTASGCSDQQKADIATLDADADSQRNLAVGSFIAGGVGLVTGVTLLVLDANRSRAQEARSLTPLVGLNYVGVAGKF